VESPVATVRRGFLARWTATVRAVRAAWSIAAVPPVGDDCAAVRSRAHLLLRECGAADVAHLGGDLLSHLEGTEAILREWRVADDVALAGLCHAAYGTDGFAPSLLTIGERPRLATAIGADAEALVYLYAGCDRGAVYPQLGADSIEFRDRFTGAVLLADRPWLTAFAELTAANELELIRSGAVREPKSLTAIGRLFAALVPYAPEPAGVAVEEARHALVGTP
jgi:hypothetical protein